MNLSVQTNAAKFQTVFSKYLETTKRIPDEILEKKGRDLGIRLFKEFRGHRLQPGRARMQLAGRAAQGQGTQLRPGLLNDYLQKRQSLRAELANFIGPKNGRQKQRDVMRRISLWQQYVGREVDTRQRGSGVLAVSFLWFRSRSSQARGTYYVKNRTGRPLGYVDRGENYLRIVGQTPGLGEVDSKYGITNQVLAGAEADMVEYINRKQRQNWEAAMADAA